MPDIIAAFIGLASQAPLTIVLGALMLACVALIIAEQSRAHRRRKAHAEALRELRNAAARARGAPGLDRPRNRTPGGWP